MRPVSLRETTLKPLPQPENFSFHFSPFILMNSLGSFNHKNRIFLTTLHNFIYNFEILLPMFIPPDLLTYMFLVVVELRT